jgi:hypothetical protein
LILVDANILLYAEDADSAPHAKARKWWDARLSGSDPVCLCWPVITAFIRIGTNRRFYAKPLTLEQATTRVQSWMEQPCVRLIYPSARHWVTFKGLLVAGQAVGNLVTDAHLAALAIDNGCVLHSTDADFSRFPRLKWKNPLA